VDGSRGRIAQPLALRQRSCDGDDFRHRSPASARANPKARLGCRARKSSILSCGYGARLPGALPVRAGRGIREVISRGSFPRRAGARWNSMCGSAPKTFRRTRTISLFFCIAGSRLRTNFAVPCSVRRHTDGDGARQDDAGRAAGRSAAGPERCAGFQWRACAADRSGPTGTLQLSPVPPSARCRNVRNL